MKERKVTMRDIAAQAGVHQTTVSLALRNHPSLPPDTRERLQRLAAEMGYRPDPALSSLVAYRRLTAAHVQTPVIAYIMNVNGPEGLAHSASRQLFLKGARAQAEAMGYRLEVFYFGHGHYHSGYLDRVLITRNITGVILAAFYTEPTDLQLSWDFYSLVKIETLPFHVRAHTISNNQYLAVRRALRELSALGYRRIGLCVAEHDEKHTDHLFSAGYHVEQAALPRVRSIPPLIFPGNELHEDPGASRERIRNWIVKHRLEVCLTNWSSLAPVVKSASRELGQPVRLVPLDVDTQAAGSWGVAQNHASVGAAAVEVLAGLMQNHQKGQPEHPRLSLIAPDWRAPTPQARRGIRAKLHTG
ncbi:MAG: LacI family DNA-binding transcriptional regulator [Verrucomicrobiota bacterium JB024]|nr:LacI family DNA-binding transcriptional regulator [Verrucomicrobiota bacterium JB024]